MTDERRQDGGRRGPAARIGLWLGPAFAVAVLLVPPPTSLSPEAWSTAGIAAWMAVWWMTEAVAIPVTALLPLVLFPTFGVLSMADTSAPYAADLIFLFMGGFFLAAGMESTGLHRRIALGVIAAVGSSPERLVLGFMLATAAISMWISNTATAAMMLPIGLAVIEIARRADQPEGPTPFGSALMLGVAYAASIGGVATLIGTPPNAVVAAAASELLGFDIGFAQWMLVGVPVVIVMLPLTWFLLVKVLHPPGHGDADAQTALDAARARLGPMRVAERRVAIVFGATALAWILRAPKAFGAVTLPGLETWIPQLRDSTIAMIAALVLFVLPRGRSEGGGPILDWPRARGIPWGVLLLFGGGLSLARAMDGSGLSAWIGGGIAQLADVPNVVLFVAIAALFVFLTEVTSNAATATMGMPILVGAGLALGVPALPLMITAGLASSMAFMLPVATPPNAIVFGSDQITIPQMVRAGLLLNLVSIALVTAVALLLLPIAFPGAP